MNAPKNTDDRDKQIFVVGDDDFNLRRLHRLERQHPWKFVPVLTHEACTDPSVSLTDKIAEAAKIIEDTGGDVDGIIAYWEFPHVAIVSKLAERFGTRWPNLDAIVRCQNKYLSRVAQQEVVPELTPKFAAVDPFEAKPGSIKLAYPFWLKPVRSHSSHLGFAIHDDDELIHALDRIRKRIGHLSGATDQLMQLTHVAEEHRHITSAWCIAEQIISGEDVRQVTAEGLVVPGEDPTIYGIVDSLRYPRKSSFLRYQYPSSMDDDTKARIHEASRKFMKHIGFEGGAFNIEFFHDEKTDRLSLLEINPRTSQSHAEMFSWVDGLSNIERVAALSTGEDEELVPPGGAWGIAAKCFYRRFSDAKVTRVPSREEIEAIEREVDGVRIQIPPKVGRRLTDMRDQDSYSFELALIHMGADDEADVERKYEAVVDRLHFEFEDVRRERGDQGRAAAVGT